MSASAEYTEVELPLIDQLEGLGWDHIEGSKYDPNATERSSFREVLLSHRLRDSLRRINIGPDNQPWLDEARLSEAVSVLERGDSNKLIEINQHLTRVLLEGTTVNGLPGWDQGRDQRVHFIDWTNPANNDLLVISQFRVDEPGGQTKKWVAPDAVLFVNGIPVVVVECKSPYIMDPMAEAIRQLRRYANQRDLGTAEGSERLFWIAQQLIGSPWAAEAKKEALSVNVT